MSQAGIISVSASGGAVSSVTGSNGVTASPTTGAVVVSGVNATTSSVGVASFNPADFTVTAGVVTLAGAATPAIKTINSIGPDASENFFLLGTANQVAITGGTNTDTISLIGPYSPSTITGVLTGNGTSAITGSLVPNNSVVIGSTNNSLSSIALSNGQLVIGSTGTTPVASTLTAGTGISITNAAGSITIESADAGFSWTNVSGTSATMVKENAYQANNAGLVTLTMPSVASSTFGDTIKVAGFGAGGWLIQCVSTQLIHFGSSATSAAGSLASTNRYDAIELVCSSTTTEWYVRYSVGNLTVA